MFYVVVILFVVAGGLFLFNFAARAGYESAEYKVLESDGEFELREYPDLMLASTEMPKRSQGNDGSFMRLFRYISGANKKEQKISMTTPVFMSESESEEKGQMGFVVPKQVTQEGVPEPSAEDVAVTKRKGGQFAVIRFSGRVDAARVAEMESKLRGWVKKKGWNGTEKYEWAGYDPPFTPGPLRRNEVLIRIREVEKVDLTAGNAATAPNAASDEASK